MTQQPPIPGEMFNPEALDNRSYAAAQHISRLFHPIMLNVMTFFIAGVYALESAWVGIMWAALCVATLVLPTLVYYRIRRRQGAFSDNDVSVRQQRNEIYLFALATLLVGLAGLTMIGTPPVFIALLVGALIVGVVNGTINLFWKISAHATAASTAATVALFYSYWLGLTLWLCALAVGWARVRTRNHTLAQVFAGFGVAAVTVMLVLWWLV